MSGNVTGSLGGQNVFLENAATEATLQMLLQATLATTKEQKKAVADLVQKAGLDPAKVAEANRGLSAIGEASALAGGALAGLNTAASSLNKSFNAIFSVADKLTDNQGKASDMFATFAGMGGVVGLVASGLERAAAFQEANLTMYQNLTQNGINFGGSLTEMREGASRMGLSMEEFGRIMKDNSQAFAGMGANANDGAKAFKNLSIEMFNSDVGAELRALGLTTSEMNTSAANYIAMTGGRTKKEMQNSEQLIKETAQYVEHLTVLSDISGKNRKEEEEKLKRASMQAAYENHIAKLRVTDPAAAARATAGMAEAMKGGQGAIETFQQKSLGFAGGMTAASRDFLGRNQNAAAGLDKVFASTQDASKSVRDIAIDGAAITHGLTKDAEALGTSGAAISIMGKGAGAVNEALKAQTLAINQGLVTEEDHREQARKAFKEVDARKTAEADQAAKTQQAFQKLGQELLTAITPLFNKLAPVLLSIGQGLASFLKYLNNSSTAFNGVLVAAGLLATAFTAVKVAQGYQATKAAFGLGGGGGGVPGVAGGAPGGGAGGAIGGAADGLGKVGPMLSSLGKGAGGLFKGIMVGIGSGLKVFANPMVMLGAVGFGASIAVIGAGIAAASWIMGKALPTLADGLLKFNDLNGKNLGEVGIGMIQMGAGLAVFGAGGAIASVGGVVGGLAEGFGSFFGVKSPIEKMKEFAALGPGLGVAGQGLLAFNTGLSNLLNTDMEKIKNLSGNLKNLAVSLNELKQASKPVEKGFFESATERLKAALTPEVTVAPTAGTPAPAAGLKPTQDSSASIANALNTQMAQLIRVSLETAENTKRAASILASRGNLLKG